MAREHLRPEEASVPKGPRRAPKDQRLDGANEDVWQVPTWKDTDAKYRQHLLSS